jgi:hypothetical protein
VVTAYEAREDGRHALARRETVLQQIGEQHRGQQAVSRDARRLSDIQAASAEVRNPLRRAALEAWCGLAEIVSGSEERHPAAGIVLVDFEAAGGPLTALRTQDLLPERLCHRSHVEQVRL